MDKAKTSKKQKKSCKKSEEVTLTPHKVLDESVYDKDTLKLLLLEALLDGDMDVFQDVLITQIRLANKSKLARRSKLGRQTLYDLIEGKKKFNPTLETLSTLLQGLYSK